MFTKEPIAAPSRRPIRRSASRRAPLPPPLAGRAGAHRRRRRTARGRRASPHPRGEHFEVPAPVARALAWRAVELDDDVPELGPAAEQPPVEGRGRRRSPFRASAPRAIASRGPPRGATRPGPRRCRRSPRRPGDRTSPRPSHADRHPRAGCSSPGRMRPRFRVEVAGHAETDPRRPVEELFHRSRHPGEDRLLRGRRVSAPRALGRAVPCDEAREDLRPSHIHPDHPVCAHGAATISARMPAGGSRTACTAAAGRRDGSLQRHTSPKKGGAATSRPGTAARRPRIVGAAGDDGSPLAPRPLLVLAVVWGVAGFLHSQRRRDANTRIPGVAKAQLAKRDGSILSDADHDPRARHRRRTRAGPRRREPDRLDACSSTRSGAAPLPFLSIPRDLRVEIPGYGTSKINAANQIGGPALTLATVKRLTGLPIDHVVVVDFDGFKELIDAVGGIEVNVPKAMLSNKFDCPYKPTRCDEWEGWRFEKGQQHMDGRRALVYSRIRTNQLDPSDTGHHAREPPADRRGRGRRRDRELRNVRAAPLRGRGARRAARDRSLCLGVGADRVDQIPRRRARCAAGSAGRRARWAASRSCSGRRTTSR